MGLRDALGPLFYNDAQFAALFSPTGQPAHAPAHRALVTVMQFAEGLSDRQAADAVRSRIDWKYALALEVTDPGFATSVLREFRARLVMGQAALRDATYPLALPALGPAPEPPAHRFDPVLAAIQVLNRLECMGETLRHALNSLARAAPDWLNAWLPPAWFDRYTRRFADYRLPDSKADRYALADQIGTDGRLLLERSFAGAAPRWRREIPAVETLRRVWVQQLYAEGALHRSTAGFRRRQRNRDTGVHA
jgi:transposase